VARISDSALVAARRELDGSVHAASFHN
jgi:hypothetical protein